MFPRGGFNANASRRKLPGIDEVIDALVALTPDNADKALVVKYIGQLVADGYAEWSMLEKGQVEVRFTSGETYLLAETDILRLS